MNNFESIMKQAAAAVYLLSVIALIAFFVYLGVADRLGWEYLVKIGVLGGSFLLLIFACGCQHSNDEKRKEEQFNGGNDKCFCTSGNPV